jgi:Predicted thioesterase involved in non-ribosomal peptide biosynthesis
MSTAGCFQNKIKLFCFPYAGGSASVYNKFNKFLDENIEIVPVEYAGRGKRSNECFYPDISCAIEDICNEVLRQIKDSEFAFFGHSMGSVITYEVCKRIRDMTGRVPVHIFVSGRYPPHILKEGKPLHILPDEGFIEEIIKIGGTPREVFENKDFAQLFMPILRADYKLIELYSFSDKEVISFNSGLTVFNGTKDNIVKKDELIEWQKYSAYTINVYEFDGGHFFLNNYTKEISEIINCTLTNSIISV